MKAQTSKTAIIIGNANDTEYEHLRTDMRHRFDFVTNHGERPVFTTNATELWDTYLRSFRSLTERQYRNCHACRRFIEKYGSLVVIDDVDGDITPICWCDYRGRDLDRKAHASLFRAVSSAKVTGVFLSSEIEWGTGTTGPWSHLSLLPVGALIRKKSRVTSDHQAMAEKVQDYETVSRALNDFSVSQLEQSVSLLQSDALYRSEKILGQAEWLLTLRRKVDENRSRRNNIIWSAVASAPSGFCHPRSSMIGTLLEDLAAGLPFSDVSRRFASKMHPLQYQRPQAPPKAGAIAAAEKIVDQLKAAGSLRRRFASLSEVQATWVPRTQFTHVRPRGGVFDHLYQPVESGVLRMKLPPQTLTWEKFERTMLPNAERIEFLPPERGSYSSLVTAVDMNAPPIIQWDHDDNRNPVSWYFWNGGSSASQYRLDHRTFCDIVAICRKPCFWNGIPPNVPDGVMLLLKDAVDTRTPGSCLFPEILKSEFHGVRSVIEAHSNATPLQRLASGPYAAGYMLGPKEKWNITIRVHMKNQIADVKLDRWD